MKRGEVFWVDFDPARGDQIRKRRPVVIVGNDVSNRVLNRVQVVPLTSKVDRFFPSEALVEVAGPPCKAMVDQIRTVAKERLVQRAGEISPADLRAAEHAIRLQLGLP